MSSLLWAQSGEVPADQAVVRSTTEVYDRDAPPAESTIEPEQGLVETDPNPDLGMTSRQVAGDYTPREKFAPWWAPEADAQYNDKVNRQVASSGTAAAREASGEFGRGTAVTSRAVDPAYHENSAFGNEYFKADERIGNEPGAVQTMTVAPGYDQDAKLKVNATGKEDIRDAAVNSVYGAWYAALIN